MVPKDQELPLWFLDGRPIKNDQLTALPPAERDRVKTKTVPAVCFSEGPGGKLDDPFVSERHQLEADTWHDLMDTARARMYAGEKSDLENGAYLPQLVVDVTEEGTCDS